MNSDFPYLDLVRATQWAALAAKKYVGLGQKVLADRAATESMTCVLENINWKAEVAIGEGKKDKSFGLFDGERFGLKDGEPEFSIAVDPIEGTNQVARFGLEAMSVLAVGRGDCFYKTEDHYMLKLAVGHSYKMDMGRPVNIDTPIPELLKTLSHSIAKSLFEMTVCVLDRPRHASLIEEIRKVGCPVKLIQDCDVTACIATCLPDSGIDVYLGAGGAPEAVIAAAAMSCLGGFFQAAPADNNGVRKEGDILNIWDLVKDEVCFCATGITDGTLVKGVRQHRGRITCDSVLMRSDKMSIQHIITEHGERSI